MTLAPTLYDELVQVFSNVAQFEVRPEEGYQILAEALMQFIQSDRIPEMTEAQLKPYLSAYLAEVRARRINPYAPPPPTPALDGLSSVVNWVKLEKKPPPETLFGWQADQREDKSLIDQLIQQTNLYATSKSFTDLLAFVARMRGFAPFNAMLLHAQKPGITHAATASDWLARFNRRPKQDARPLIVMQAMGPVGFVFDVLDTEGAPLPPEAFAFPTFGDLSLARWHEMLTAVSRAKIEILWVDKGDGAAGSMTRREMVVKGKARAHWTVRVNQNHDPQTQFVTLAHELAHMFLGHLGGDDNPSIKARRGLGHDLQEVEAETVAWVVAHRNGLKPKSEAYLDRYKAAFKGLEVFTILRAANAVETAMGISAAQLAKAGQAK
ncbi:protein of unknown function [Pseudorhodobacter antarcticus]|jgi:hypothetical protein|uniref:IrrE N-terminal-like domain-containing protein n=1 Tax=Pseudorhodobacter antarcticus TaxID=1077947 RepID=A0A1H8M1G5_9RHOB|nr:ImmA/IrrE family metallo-endopeptidase [Pseudorhodobacter antarcticus]SEO11213.1 protein of unknown function [Pseudorhodobacter antarcticus]